MAELEKIVEGKKEKAYTFGQLMNRWYHNVFDPFDAVIYGVKMAVYGTHAIQTFRRSESDHDKGLDERIAPLKERRDEYSKRRDGLRRKGTRTDADMKEINSLEKRDKKLYGQIRKLEKKKDRGNGWTTVTVLGTGGAVAGGYYLAGTAAAAALGPVGWAVCGVPVVTQTVSHIAESLVKAKRELVAEYQEKKKE